jgi:hypothetical protein
VQIVGRKGWGKADGRVPIWNKKFWCCTGKLMSCAFQKAGRDGLEGFHHKNEKHLRRQICLASFKHYNVCVCQNNT